MKFRDFISLRVALGGVVCFVSYVLIDYVSGGIFRATPDVPNLQMTAFITPNEDAHLNRAFYRSKISLRNPENIQFTVSLFDNILDRTKRRSSVDTVESVTLRFNFTPLPSLSLVPSVNW